jgi:spermidine synthase
VFRVIVGDGYQYIHERADTAPKFDYAFVDTSYDDDFHLMMSPVAIFARDEFAANLRKHMNSAECAVTVNTYTHHKELEKLVMTKEFKCMIFCSWTLKNFATTCWR